MEKIDPQTSKTGNLEASSDRRDYKFVSTDVEKDLSEANLTVESPAESPEVAAGSTENNPDENRGSNKKKKNKLKEKAKGGEDETQNMDQTNINTGSTETITEGNMNGKRKRGSRISEEIKIMNQVDSLSKFHLSDSNHGEGNDGRVTENEYLAKDFEISARKESSLSVSVHNKAKPLELCKDEEVEISERKESALAGFMHMENHLSMCKEGETVTLPVMVEGTSYLSSPSVKEAVINDLEYYPGIMPIPSITRKLIVLDVNGLLANIVMPAPKDYRGDTHILGRAIFKRPFCDDFLKFCFQNFVVGVWSSRSKRIIDRVVDYLLGDQKDKLLFCWDMSHSTQTGYNTLENVYKPLVFKELRKIWENDDPSLPWKNGDYNESNTLLLDDSPYKALLNPLYTAVFPNSYHYKDPNDNSLGPGGDLRVYLEGLLSSENVQEYVEQHPFGQSAINETNLSWGFYSGVLQTMSEQLQDDTIPSSIPMLS